MHAELCVVGGGPAGAACAVLAAAAGMRVTLVHDGAPARRADTLAPLAVRALPRLGLGASLESSGAMRSSGTVDAFGPPRYRTSIASPWGPAWHVDRDRFDAALRGLAQTRGARLLAGAVRRVERGPTGFTVHTTSHATTCDRLVDATGAVAAVARLLGVRHRTLDRQVAVFAHTAAALAEPCLAVARSRYGWTYLTPLSGGRAQLALVTDAASLRQAAPADALRAAARALDLDAETTAVWTRAVLCRVVGSPLPPGFFVVGDAEWTPDPLSGQGIARALRSAEELVARLLAAHPDEAAPSPVPPMVAAVAHLRRRSSLLAGGAAPAVPHSLNRARALQGAEECLHGDSLRVD